MVERWNWVAINFSWAMSSELINQFMGVILLKFDHFLTQNPAWKKWTVRDFFGPIFFFFGPKLTYTDLSKNRPHKKHCAWAPTPPWRKVEIYWFFTIFIDFGVFNRAGKTVSKIGIYALPPLKMDFYGCFINSRPNFGNCWLFIFGPWYIFFTLPFFGPWHIVYSGKNPTVFLLFWSLV
jgi:hypothetical protein